jgi:hypothetical protein
VIQAAFSGLALTNIFTTSMNAGMLSGYMHSPDTTGGWCREVDNDDFKTNDRIRMNVASNLDKLPRGKTAEHESFEDSKESCKLARYACAERLEAHRAGTSQLRGWLFREAQQTST